jgi:glycosyltransferase involved in cell wall biosynthesis
MSWVNSVETKYKLSVVVLVYNTEQYLRDCLDSLVNQTLEDIEIIVVNDGSPDDSHIIIEEYKNKYDNIKVINQENSGGAIAGNNGLHVASGEYVTLVDSDDIVPFDAYEKLYNKAVSTNSDIVIGKANILVNGVQQEVRYKNERKVWSEERTIDNLYQFLDIFYDAFYWNKIIKRELIFKYNCFMPPGMLYADRPMVHKAYLYAKKISIITDLVYLWRKRGNDAKHKSVSQTNSDIKNFLDRIDSYNYQINYFNEYGDPVLKNEFLKRNIDRLFFPIRGILDDIEFRKVYLKNVKSFLQNIKDVYDNELGVLKNLYIYFILHDQVNYLIQFLEDEPKGEIIEEEGIYYWALPLFRNEKAKIPDDLFKIKDLIPSFISIDNISLKKEVFSVENVELPNMYDVNCGKLIFKSRKDLNESLIFPLERKEKNNFAININLDQIKTNLFDIYISFSLNQKEYEFRITKSMLKNEFDFLNEDKHRLYFTKKGNLSLLVNRLKIINFKLNQEGLLIELNNMHQLPISFYLNERSRKQKIYFQQFSQNIYKLKWEHFLDVDEFYDIYFMIYNLKVRINSSMLPALSKKTLYLGNAYIKLYETNKKNISIGAMSNAGRFIRKIKSGLKRLIK